MYVVDASVVIKWFIDEDGHEDALQLTKMQVQLTAPDILLAEVAHVLRRKIRMGIVSRELAVNAIATVKMAFGDLIPSMRLIDRAFELSSTMDHSIYDSIYLACALEGQGHVLVTGDRKFASKAALAGYGGQVVNLDALETHRQTRQENDNG